MSPWKRDPKGLLAVGVLGFAVALAGCASLEERPRASTPEPDGPPARAAVRQPPNPREYYDQRAGRHYYFDAKTARYYWEDGTPKY
jgi:hypothetical protein